MNQSLSPSTSQNNLKVCSTETKENGESIQLVRPYTVSAKSTAEIVGDLVSNFSYRTMPVKASENELHAVQQAFGSSLASELIKTYDGSNLVSDSQQDLIGERYLAEQIKLIEQQQRDSSVLNKWSHLLYEGEKYEKPTIISSDLNRSSSNMLTTVTEVTSNQLTSTDQSAAEISQGYSYIPNELLIESKIEAVDVEKTHEAVLNEIIEAVKEQNNIIDKQKDKKETLESFEIKSDAIEFEINQTKESKEYTLEIDTVAEKTVQNFREQIKDQTEGLLEVTKAEVVVEKQKTIVDDSQDDQSFKKSLSQKKFNLKNIQQPADYLPQLSSSNLNSVTLDAYNSPQFKTMLEQILKPITVPTEEINYPADWPSPDKIAYLSEPIYIPAPLPIVIPAPNILTERDYNELPEEISKPYVTHYPKPVHSIASDQMNYQNFGIRQLNLQQ